MADQEDNSGWDSNTGEQENKPQLYSKTIILVFAILFSVIFAAALLIINLRNLGKKSAAAYVFVFAILYLIATAVVLQVFSLDPGLTFVANVIGAAILNEFFWNKYIGQDYEFEKKSWIKPTLISLAIVMVFFLLMMGSMGM